MKKGLLRILLCLGVICVLVGVSVSVYVKKTNNSNKEKESIVKDCVLELSRLYQTEDIDLSRFEFTETGREDVEDIKEMLRAFDNATYVLSTKEELEQEGCDVISPPELDDDGHLIKVEDDGADEELTYADIVFEEDGDLLVYVNDLEFDEEGRALVEVGGGYREVYIEDVEETYEMMKSNPAYSNYICTDMVKVRDNITVTLKSEISGNIKRATVKLDGYKIAHIWMD